TAATLPREPGFVLAADATCETLYTQRLDGALVATKLAPDHVASEVIAQADGYAYLVRFARSNAGDEPVGAGIWLAFSSGAIARIDEAARTVRVVAYAVPRASALGDGPGPGDVTYVDATGVVVVRAGGRVDGEAVAHTVDHVLDAVGGTTW